MTDEEPQHRNEIVLVGRVTSPAAERTLPSGDVIRQWRVTVDRAGAGGGFDVVDCTAWTARLQRSAATWRKGDIVEVEGALRRRFWRGSGGALGSSCEIEVSRARRLAVGPTRLRDSG
jgi:single-strand DNA-binding protein